MDVFVPAKPKNPTSQGEAGFPFARGMARSQIDVLSNDAGVVKSPNPRDLPPAFQQVILYPAAGGAFCESVNDDGVAKSPKPRDLPLRFQQVISFPAARERVFANASILQNVQGSIVMRWKGVKKKVLSGHLSSGTPRLFAWGGSSGKWTGLGSAWLST